MPQKKPATATRSRRGFGRLRQRGSGRWQASYLHHGQLHYAPATFPTKDSGAAWLQNERDLIDLDRRKPGTWTPPAERVTKAAARKLTLRDYAKPWLEHRSISPRTSDNYEYHLERNILPTLGDSALAEITPEDVRVWFTSLGSEHRTRNAQAYGVLQAVMNTAVDDRLIDRSPARIKGAAAVKHTKRSVVLLEPDELAALADKMPEALRLTVLLAGWCGLRRGELFALTRADVADDGTTVRVEQGGDVPAREVRGRADQDQGVQPHRHRAAAPPPDDRRTLASARRGGQDGADVPRPGDGRVLRRGPLPHTVLQRPTSHRQGRTALPRPAALRRRDGAVAGGTTKEVMARLGHVTSGTAMRYQHVAAGRADMLADRLSALAAPVVAGDAPAAE